jgi:hypothetical protein
MEANPQRIEWPQLGPRKTTAHEGISQVRVIQTKSVEAVGIEHLAIHLMPTILERFRGQVSVRTRPKNTNGTR